MLKSLGGLKEEGRVRVELYDASGSVFDSFQTHNVVTDVAAKIIIDTLANPGGFQVYERTELLSTPSLAADDGFYHVTLSQHRYKLGTAELTSTGQASYVLPGSGRVEVLRRVTVDYNPVGIGTDVWISEPSAREITFATSPAVGTPIEVEYLEVYNQMSRLEPYSEVVTVGVQTYSRSTAKDVSGNPIPTAGTYVIDYDTGDVKFSQQLSGITITYKYLAARGVAYMGISDRPSGWTVGSPIVFTDSNRNKLALDAEYPGTRQLIKSPSQVLYGTQTQDNFTGDGAITEFGLSHKPVVSLDQVLVNGNPVQIGVDVTLSSAEKGLIKFTIPPASGAQIQAKYTYYSSATAVFVADFPPGVPGISIEERTDNITTNSSQNSYVLTYVPREVLSVTLNGTPLASGTDYAINSSSKTIVLTSTPPDNGALVVTYTWEKTWADIYEVGLFDSQEGGLMFAISGIGPITKDQNTGMRVSWSTTLSMV